MRFIPAVPAILFLLLLSFQASAVEYEERLLLDPVLQGVWMIHIFSDDGGKTVHHTSPPEPFLRARSTSVRFTDGTERRIEQIKYAKIEGTPTLFILLDNGMLYVCGKEAGEADVFVQIYKRPNGELVESGRMIVTVE